MNDKTKRKINGCALVVIILSVAVILFIATKGDGEPTEGDIKEAARAQIIHALKDPTSAEFFHNNKFSKQSDSIYVYTESLKALNGFGLKTAQDAYVKIKWDGNDPGDIENYTLIDIQFKAR